MGDKKKGKEEKESGMDGNTRRKGSVRDEVTRRRRVGGHVGTKK